jgi:hypothetical protein
MKSYSQVQSLLSNSKAGMLLGFKLLLAASALEVISACSSSDGGGSSLSSPATSSENLTNSLNNLQQKKLARLDLSLTDAPNRQLTSVVVNVDYFEVLLSKGGKNARVTLNKGLGPIDLLKLQNGVTLPLSNVEIPQDVQIQQIRLILKPEGHFAVKSDQSICQLKTPSAQKTGLKIILTNQFSFESGAIYKVLIDFDALKSVVVQGNGKCLLKPVIKIKNAIKVIPDVVPDDGDVDSNPDTDEVDIIVDDSQTGGSSTGSTDSSTTTSTTTSTTLPATDGSASTDVIYDDTYIDPLDIIDNYFNVDPNSLVQYYQ